MVESSYLADGGMVRVLECVIDCDLAARFRAKAPTGRNKGRKCKQDSIRVGVRKVVFRAFVSWIV